MTCGIWKRSLLPSGFIILPQPGKPWGCPRLHGPFAPSLAVAGEQGEGLRWPHWGLWQCQGSPSSEGSHFSCQCPCPSWCIHFPTCHRARGVTGTRCWEGWCCKATSSGGTGFEPAFVYLPLLTAPSLFPFKQEPAVVVPSLCTAAEGKCSPSLFHLFNFLAGLAGKCFSPPRQN